MIAFRLSALARSRIRTASACCWAGVKLFRLGQSILATVDTHAARNSRGAAGGRLARSSALGSDTGALPQALSKALATPASANARRFGFGSIVFKLALSCP